MSLDLTAWNVALDRLDRLGSASRWRTDPVAWVRERLHEEVWSKQGEIMRDVAAHPLVAVQSCHGVGKLVSRTTEHWTARGWVSTQDLRVGDRLWDESGHPTVITGLSPWWRQEMYRITFSDGATVEAGQNHEWAVLDLTRRPRGVTDWRDHWGCAVILTTEQLFKAGVKTTAGQNRWRIPLAAPLQAPEANLPIDPYLLGFWLGDGTAVNARITIGQSKRGLLAELDRIGVGYSAIEKKPGVWRVGLHGVAVLLRELGVLANKHIPHAYLHGSEAQRRALLAGILDADGFAMNGALVGIDLTDHRLADDVHHLLVTLGISVRRSEGEAAYTTDGARKVTGCRMNFRPLVNPFRIRNQEWADTPAQRSRHTLRTIVSIEPLGMDVSRCIEVDSPRSLYLTGRDLIPTHNSFLASRLALWWLDVHPVGKAMVVTSAPTSHQVRAVLWRYIRQGHANGGLAGYITQGQVPEWKIDGELVAYGRKPADHQQSAFQGQHADHLLVILDEACGIPKWLWDASDSLATGEHGRILAIGNPDDNGAHFYVVCTTEPGWTRHRISAFDSPAFTGEQVPPAMAAGLVTRAWVEDKQLRWGETNPLYRAKVLGEFVDSEDGLIPLSWVRAANARWHAWHESGAAEQPGRRIIGVDVARYGTDSTAIAIREADVIREVRRWSKKDTVETAALVEAELSHPASHAVVDVIGVGAGVLDMLRRHRRSVVGFNAAAATRRRDATGMWRFPNVRSAAWWNLRELLDPSTGATLALPEDDELTADLITPTWRIGTGNTIHVESKDEMRKRLGRSTDTGDAVVQALWVNPSTGRSEHDDEGNRIPTPKPRARRYADAPTWT